GDVVESARRQLEQAPRATRLAARVDRFDLEPEILPGRAQFGSVASHQNHASAALGCSLQGFEQVIAVRERGWLQALRTPRARQLPRLTRGDEQWRHEQQPMLALQARDQPFP